MDVVPFGPEHVRSAAACHAAAVRWQRELVPELPGALEEEDVVADLLDGAVGVAAVEAGRLVGYLTARRPIPRFRRTSRTAAFVPAWGHGVVHDDPEPVYRAMYRAASRDWAGAGCGVHAISVLDVDGDVTDVWFAMGFGELVVDAVVTDRPSTAAPARMATTDDAEGLARLDREHVLHYSLPPTSMIAPPAMDAAGWAAHLARDRYGASVVEQDGRIAGFMRFSDRHGGADLTRDAGGAFIDGAYVRPDLRGRGLASALLAAGLDALARRGVTRVALDHESVNPSAAAFWPRWSAPVCHSLQRILEDH